MLQVNFGIYGGILQAVEEVRDVREQISVFLCDFIEASKLSAEMERAIFLLSEEEWSAMRQEQRSEEPHG